ncbi:23S rRNA (pseudouridine(1915)-N(3))-methyltransferase RlmH [Ectothiorhodospiraceae bacterium WFHF3C12]|nr:23S rRNA (pseudouridine(1915)-N(3))-methyltransferase RlmH [Ectothiorhodospiraceae bacterium WFHF3C12]
MKLQIIAVGQRMPRWVQDGFHEYAGRLPPQLKLSLTEVPLGGRGKSAAADGALREEGERLLAAVPRDALVIALDARGRSWSTEDLAGRLDGWMQGGRDVAFLVGGPDGLSAACLERAEARWSLSTLTLPHMMVRVILAEQLYRAWTILQNHPYHR